MMILSQSKKGIVNFENLVEINKNNKQEVIDE